jgi:hypothetical protein
MVSGVVIFSPQCGQLKTMFGMRRHLSIGFTAGDHFRAGNRRGQAEFRALLVTAPE